MIIHMLLKIDIEALSSIKIEQMYNYWRIECIWELISYILKYQSPENLRIYCGRYGNYIQFICWNIESNKVSMVITNKMHKWNKPDLLRILWYLLWNTDYSEPTILSSILYRISESILPSLITIRLEWTSFCWICNILYNK